MLIIGDYYYYYRAFRRCSSTGTIVKRDKYGREPEVDGSLVRAFSAVHTNRVLEKTENAVFKLPASRSNRRLSESNLA